MLGASKLKKANFAHVTFKPFKKIRIRRLKRVHGQISLVAGISLLGIAYTINPITWVSSFMALHCISVYFGLLGFMYANEQNDFYGKIISILGLVANVTLKIKSDLIQ